MNDDIIQYCLTFIENDEIKKNFKIISKPIINFILSEISPYLYFTLILMFIIFIINLAILIILLVILQNKTLLNKFF
jgi:hypothetical protein